MVLDDSALVETGVLIQTFRRSLGQRCKIGLPFRRFFPHRKMIKIVVSEMSIVYKVDTPE